MSSVCRFPFAGLLLFIILISCVRAETVVALDPARSQGVWDGWGTSLCWWAKVFGDRDEIADILFTRKTVEFLGEKLPGLGLNIARYNVGACSWNEVDGRRMVVSKTILPFRQMEGFWLDGKSEDPQSKSWDWSVDRNQRTMLQKAKDRGVNLFELFSNSPTWWMCRNDNPSGQAKELEDNLAPENYGKFATYIATVARQAKDHWGILFTTVAPFNEPSAKWWVADGKQEGCHFAPPAQAAVLPLLRKEMNERGLADMAISASDESYYDEAVTTWRSFDEPTKALVSQVNVHGYQNEKGRRDLLFEMASKDGKRLWNSEYGEIDVTGIQMIRNLHLDFRDLRPTAWCYWHRVAWSPALPGAEGRKSYGKTAEGQVASLLDSDLRGGECNCAVISPCRLPSLPPSKLFSIARNQDVTGGKSGFEPREGASNPGGGRRDPGDLDGAGCLRRRLVLSPVSCLVCFIFLMSDLSFASRSLDPASAERACAGLFRGSFQPRMIRPARKVAGSLAAVWVVIGTVISAVAADPGVRLHWLEGKAPAVQIGTTLGVPWPQGALKKGAEFALKTEAGVSVPVQSWPLAYWPDGSLKWTAHAILGESADSYVLAPGSPKKPEKPLVVKDTDVISIDTGLIQCTLPRSGRTLIASLTREGREIARNGRLVCLRQDQADPGGAPVETFAGEISKVIVEQTGPVRAVVRIEGRHANESGRAWLPFVVRLYFYAGSDAIRVMHTIIYDGEEKKDFIRGLGLRFDVPMRGELHDRHVRFAGENGGLWAEAVRGLTGLRRDPGEAVRRAQIAGTATPPASEWNSKVANGLGLIPAFGDFTLYQPTADSFEVRKRTREGFVWLNSAYGRRAAGFAYAGTPVGGFAFGIRNFWQSHPSQLDIRGAAGEVAEVTMWLWSPEARPMDMRPYHDGLGMDTFQKQREGLDITYEDYEPGFDTAKGVARTSEMIVWALAGTPARERLVELAETLQAPPALVCPPATYKAAEVFGGAIWDLPDRSTPVRAAIEDQLDFYFETYKREVDQRHWYGFWNYGDVMHTYDADRHVWRYDVGGFAWDNSELSPDLWLWYTFLRTGRADVFRMAEAMTRHTGEVDVYHLGRFAGLGSRHNVLHWGDSAKQLRISTAENRRFLYYLTADERIGDLMRETLHADRQLAAIPPGRKLPSASADQTRKPFSMKMGVGTDWMSMAAAWLTEWERTGENKYRDKLVISMKTIAALPHGWLSGGGGYDPETGEFFADGEEVNVSHLSVVFGGFEVNAELLQLLDVPAYKKTWLQYCELYNGTQEEQARALGSGLRGLNLAQAHSRLTAYAAWQKNEAALGKRAWTEFFAAGAGIPIDAKPRLTSLRGPRVLNPIEEAEISTNAVSQFGLAAIQNLGLAGKWMPSELPDPPSDRERRGRSGN